MTAARAAIVNRQRILADTARALSNGPVDRHRLTPTRWPPSTPWGSWPAPARTAS